MTINYTLTLIIVVTSLLGCAVQLTNKEFETFRNTSIGTPLYASHEKYYKKVKKLANIYEYVSHETKKGKGGCKYALIVDTRKRGVYTNKHGYTSKIAGIIIGWKYLSSKEYCKAGTNYWGPW